MKQNNMEKEKKEPLKLQGAKHGTIRQKMMSFKLDNDNALWLDTKPNKGRYINNLIRADRLRDIQQPKVEPK